MEKKYEMTDETIEVDGKTLHRIRALRDFSDVEKGDLGGYIEREGNLSHENSCWVYHNAKVYGNARVYGHASIYDGAEIYDNALIYDNAEVYGDAKVYGDAVVHLGAHVGGYTAISTGEKTR
ncbi:hypothetical protein [Bartonella gliris]|uniref:hypothetical protein n=1 Tax=Bartonella gliris TaxID=3004109 RepID=UPI003872B365